MVFTRKINLSANISKSDHNCDKIHCCFLKIVMAMISFMSRLTPNGKYLGSKPYWNSIIYIQLSADSKIIGYKIDPSCWRL